MTQPRLRSDRLILRPPHESDADFMVEALSDRAVWEWLSVIPQPYTRDHALAFINEISNGQNWVIEHQGAPTGVIGLAETLGYWLARRYWGQGIVTEAGYTLIRHSFSDPDRSQIASAYFIGNDRSRRALEKLGFQDAGPHRLGCLSDGRENIPARRMILTRRRWQTLTEPAPRLTTARLTLRPLTPEDSPAVHAIVSHWEVAKQLASWPWPPDAAFTTSRCAPYTGRGWVWAICRDGALIGTIGVTQTGPDAPGIGYMLSPGHQGRGLMTEAAQAAIAHAFQATDWPGIEAFTWADNAPSQSVLTRLGFTQTGTDRKRARARGQITEGVIFWLPRPNPSSSL